jgi:hypothetical protein
VSGKALFPELTREITGGISRYKPVENDLLVRDATCAAGLRAKNASTLSDSNPASVAADIRQIRVLIAQSRKALMRAVSAGDLTGARSEELEAALDSAEESLDPGALERAGARLLDVCVALGGA